MSTCAYGKQAAAWPAQGRHILARYDADSIYVYQAYRPSIAQHALEHQRFCGEHFSYSRMSWIKPNFLWMMYRCGWASKPGQEYVLAVRLRRAFFDELLLAAVSSSFEASPLDSREEWHRSVAASEVRLQWDPDHDPAGKPLDRRAIQLGLRGRMLKRYGDDEILSIEDITPFVKEQSLRLPAGFDDLLIPEERVYSPTPEAAFRLGVEQYAGVT
jgi:hypothetical protein